MNILIACEESQSVCNEFRKLGFNAYSCDLIAASGGHPEWHIQDDVLPLLNGFCEFCTCDGVHHSLDGRWDLIIAFPPCTYMTKAGARWMYPSSGQISYERLEKALAAKEFFYKFLNADCGHVAIENPRPLKVVGLPVPTQVIQPYEYGHPYSKATCLWLKGLPNLVPTDFVEDYKPYLPSNTSGYSKGFGGSKGGALRSFEDAKIRSKTFSGIAAAMARQWSDYLVSNLLMQIKNINDEKEI